MQRLRFTQFINAPREKVWDTMLQDATYREWTNVFSPGSYFKGNWEKGSKIFFLGPDMQGGEGGMVSRIKEYKLHEYISIEHLGIVVNGVEDLSSAKMKDWEGAQENYTFTDKDGGTELTIETDVAEDEKQRLESDWSKALSKLKSLAES